MNREIKFRAYDKILRIIITFEEMTCHESMKEYGRRDTLNGFLSNPDYEVMQFTGLVDKNEKEIYEGDILRYPCESDWDNINYQAFEVFWHDGNESNGIGFKITRTHNHGSICGGYIPKFIPDTASKLVVIGNIHENPELLKS
jgi:uncharacterized phage protein (TIGR01671 family)